MDLKTDVSFSDKLTLEKYSSAFTLSDMEIFIFPELFYPLILSNIMSPLLWAWRDDPWFKDIENKGFTYKANRIKQFIIQNYVFNLDLTTWGLTTKEREIARFSEYFDMEMLKQSNALFGYEGDKYYFDIDIRKHFGLDKFNSDVIPYWKTETIEAMNAFRYKENFSTGAGECVSLSALYAAAMFVVGRVPIDNIFLIATPLHSQNFIIEREGLITNNRRIVTKNMWFNGTSLSEKARRALENEKVTIVSHISGYIHIVYDEATIDKASYKLFSGRLKEFLVTGLTSNIFINFLRFNTKYKSLFQYKCVCSGISRYITLEKLFEYEHTSKFSVSAETRALLIKEIEGDDFHLSPVQNKILLNDMEEIIIKSWGKDLQETEKLLLKLSGNISSGTIQEMFSDLARFLKSEPMLPGPEKNYVSTNVIHISPDDTREAIVDTINEMADVSETALLTRYVFRMMDKIGWLPFIKAAIERNPVYLNDLSTMNTEEVYQLLGTLPGRSIYDGSRLAQPDEVWNFRRGDGIEKAILLAGFIIFRNNSSEVSVEIDKSRVIVTVDGQEYRFLSEKHFRKSLKISGTNYSLI